MLEKSNLHLLLWLWYTVEPQIVYTLELIYMNFAWKLPFFLEVSQRKNIQYIYEYICIYILFIS